MFYEHVAGEFVVLDTETTGLGADAEIVSIGIVDQDGLLIFSSLVKPKRSIPRSATKIHGITNAMVEHAPSWADIQDIILMCIADKVLVIYNAAFDLDMLDGERGEVGGFHYSKTRKTVCAMEQYAYEYGAWSEWHQSYTWCKLTTAAARFGIDITGAHGSLADARMTAKLVQAMKRANDEKAKKLAEDMEPVRHLLER